MIKARLTELVLPCDHSRLTFSERNSSWLHPTWPCLQKKKQEKTKQRWPNKQPQVLQKHATIAIDWWQRLYNMYAYMTSIHCTTTNVKRFFSVVGLARSSVVIITNKRITLHSQELCTVNVRMYVPTTSVLQSQSTEPAFSRLRRCSSVHE